MELEKKQFQMKKTGRPVESQFVTDADVNVPDSKDDVRRILLSEGSIRPAEVRVSDHAIRVGGRIHYHMLYETEERETKISSIDGEIPFEETIYVEEDTVSSYVIDQIRMDFQTTMIHSRKLNVKAVIEIRLLPENVQEEEITVDVGGESSVLKKKRDVLLLQLVTSKTDTYRIKEEITIPGTKEAAAEILWCDVTAGKTDTRLGDGELIVEGELSVFCFYESPDGKPDWIETRVPYEGRISCLGVESHMYHFAKTQLCDITSDIRPDDDGEMRCIGIEATLKAEISVYEEETVSFLEDLYSLQGNCKTQTRTVCYEEPVMQNHSKCRVSQQLTLPEIQDDILQICHSGGNVQVERMLMTGEGILVEGVLHISFLYVKANDTMPFDVWQGMVPFFHMIASNDTDESVCYDISTALEQLSVSLLGGDGVEVKAVLAFHGLLRKEITTETIDSFKIEEELPDELEKQPGIVGYVVKEGDSLWSLAKRCHTTMDYIREINQMQEENVKPGQRILIFKENMSIL